MADEDDIPGYDHPAFAPSPQHKPWTIKGKNLDLMTDEELRPLLQWNPNDPSQRDQPFPGMPAKPKSESVFASPASDSGPAEPSPTNSPGLGGAPSRGNNELLEPGEKPFSFDKSSGASPSWDRPVDAQLIDVIDGDTIHVRMPDGQKKTVRLRGYSAGEMGLTGSKEARDAVEKLLASGKVRLSNIDDDEDPYGRVVATVGIEGVPDIGQLLARNGFGTQGSPRGRRTAAEDDIGPSANEWRQIRRGLDPDALAESYDLAKKKNHYGMLKKQRRLNQSDPEYQQYLQDMAEFMQAHGGNLKPRKASAEVDLSGVPKPVADAIQRMLDRRRSGVDMTPPSAREFYLRPESSGEWARWTKMLKPKERNLWDRLKRDEEAFLAKAPAYHKKEYLQTKPYLEHRRLYDKFLHLTTERMRRYEIQHPERQGRRRRRRSDLSPELMTAIG